MKLPAFTLAGLMLASVDGDKALALLEEAFAADQRKRASFGSTFRALPS